MNPVEKFIANIQQLTTNHQQAKPFPHTVLDHFFPDEIIENAWAEFPTDAQKKEWIHYYHFNENKHGLNTKEAIPNNILSIIDYLNSATFVQFLENLTGIKNLITDDSLEGGGIHLSKKGGYLNIHADFETHPKNAYLIRKINVLLYLNKEWKEEYNGALELWSSDMKHCVNKISPVFNRLVIFNTTAHSFHGFPDKLNCPATETRRSIALYYYVKTDFANPIKPTKYRTKPTDFLSRVPNFIDNSLLYIYTLAKRKLNINDQPISDLLNWKEWFSKKKN